MKGRRMGLSLVLPGNLFDQLVIFTVGGYHQFLVPTPGKELFQPLLANKIPLPLIGSKDLHRRNSGSTKIIQLLLYTPMGPKNTLVQTKIDHHIRFRGGNPIQTAHGQAFSGFLVGKIDSRGDPSKSTGYTSTKKTIRSDCTP